MTELRMLLAGVVGGGVIFIMGWFGHAVLNLGGRTIHVIPGGTGVEDAIAKQELKYGVYQFPYLEDKDWQEKAKVEAFTKKYKAGPNGMLFVGRTNEQPMGMGTLGLEFGSNVLFALLAAWVVMRFKPEDGFILRWLAIVVIGVAAWASLSASQHIWYRFHWDFVIDELYCVLLETSVGGLAIAALAKPEESTPATAKK